MKYAGFLMKFQISNSVQQKIQFKHGIRLTELRLSLHEGNPKILRLKENYYLAITHLFRYITIVYELNNNIADVLTAYESSDAQIKKYTRK